MFEKLDYLYLSAQTRIRNFFNDLKNDESGVSSIVATVLLILIVVMLAAIFWDKIQEWFETMWAKIVQKSDLN